MSTIFTFIVGAGRSGSTLLQRLLSVAPATSALGETTQFWRTVLGTAERCECGVGYLECEFWSKIVERVAVDDAEALSLVQSSMSRRRELLRHLRGNYDSRERDYASSMWHVLDTSAEIARARVVVDTSKNPLHAQLLVRNRDSRRAVVIHLVRDPRAVANSMARTKTRVDAVDPTEAMPTYGILQAAYTWTWRNLISEALASSEVPYVRIRYEDLVGDPAATASVLAPPLGLAIEPLAEAWSSPTVQIPQNHTVAGNPGKFDGDVVRLQPDTRWQRDLGRVRATAVSVMTPLRRRYGYTFAP